MTEVPEMSELPELPDEAVATLDPRELTLVVMPWSDQQLAEQWLAQWEATPGLHGARIVLAYRSGETADLPRLRSALEPEQEIEIPDDDDDLGRAASLAALRGPLLGAPTPYVAVTSIARVRSRALENLHRQLEVSLGRLHQLDLGSRPAGPLLLSTNSAPGLAVQAFVSAWLAAVGTEPPDGVRSYLAHLTLVHGNTVVEGIDPVPETGEIDVFARVSFGRQFAETPPPWQYRLALMRSGSNEVVAETPAQLSRRVDNQGNLRWENLRARLPLADLPDGNYRVLVLVAAANEVLRPRRLMRARPGVTAPARTVLVPARDDAAASRYLVHTRGRDGHTWITVQHGDGPRQVRRWRRTLLRKDVRLVVSERSAGYRMRLARLVRLVTRPFFAHREIWLVGERVDTAQDNGMHLFRHLRTHHPRREVYYVIDKSSAHTSRIADLGNVVQHSSWRHQLLMLHAAVLANAYSINHMVPRSWPLRAYTQHLAWRVGAVRVYLKHGVNVSANTVKRGTGGYDVYLSVNPRETAALRESSRYGEQVQETGMPRYDALTPGPASRTVLFMPTWRRYLVPKLFGDEDDVAKVPFRGSTYERFLSGLLHSPRLHELLERYDYRLQFLPHYNLAAHLTSFTLTSPRTELVDTAKQSFGELISGCDAFVTDHSSVHFDVAYLGTPVVYAHFDADEYAAGHASTSWFEHERDGFGPVVHTVEETLDALAELLARGCEPDPRFAARVDAAFTFRDHENCARVVDVIERRIAEVRNAG